MLDKNIVNDVLMAALSHGGDFAEVFAEDRFDSSIGMIEGKVERSSAGRTAGVGIRIFIAESKRASAATSNITRPLKERSIGTIVSSAGTKSTSFAILMFRILKSKPAYPPRGLPAL